VLKVLGLEIPNGESEVFLEMSKAKILIVEDELDIRELIALHLGREGYPVDQCESGADGLKKITNRPSSSGLRQTNCLKISVLNMIK